LKIVDLPTLGRPIIPAARLIDILFLRKGDKNSSE
jgi:hypothetical protein